MHKKIKHPLQINLDVILEWILEHKAQYNIWIKSNNNNK